ncbi:MAG: transposase [Victivallaceae bacterium]|nr:transposase [Victivallaceae bacterium]
MSHRLSHEDIAQLSFEDALETLKTELTPLYTLENTTCVHALHYSWAGWRSQGVPLPTSIGQAVEQCSSLWQQDGFQLGKQSIKADMVQCLFAVAPEIAPVKFTQRVKGRLDHQLRQQGDAIKFSRKVGFRCLGENIRETVNNYVHKQVCKSDYIDSRYKQFLSQFTVADDSNDLAIPVAKSHGRYWYNIHLVIVVADRNFPIKAEDKLEQIRAYIPRIAQKKGCEIAHFSILPDHIHIALKGNPELSPYEIGLSFMNNLSYVLGFNWTWSNEFYVGTFSEYALSKLR